LNKTKLILYFELGKTKAKSEWNQKQNKVKQRSKQANKIKQGRLSEEDQRGTITKISLKTKCLSLEASLQHMWSKTGHVKIWGCRCAKRIQLAKQFVKLLLVRGFSSKHTSDICVFQGHLKPKVQPESGDHKKPRSLRALNVSKPFDII